MENKIKIGDRLRPIKDVNIDIFFMKCILTKDKEYEVTRISHRKFLDIGEGFFALDGLTTIIEINGCEFPFNKKLIFGKDINIILEDHFEINK